MTPVIAKPMTVVLIAVSIVFQAAVNERSAILTRDILAMPAVFAAR